jgi:hypothetical protein
MPELNSQGGRETSERVECRASTRSRSWLREDPKAIRLCLIIQSEAQRTEGQVASQSSHAYDDSPRYRGAAIACPASQPVVQAAWKL